MDVAAMFKIQIQIPVAAPLSLATAGIRCAGLANPGKSLNDLPAIWICQQVVLNRQEDRIGGIPGQFLQSPRKDERFNKYHTVRYTTRW